MKEIKKQLAEFDEENKFLLLDKNFELKDNQIKFTIQNKTIKEGNWFENSFELKFESSEKITNDDILKLAKQKISEFLEKEHKSQERRKNILKKND